MPKIMSNSKEQLNDKAQRFFEASSTVQEPIVAYRHDYATEAHNESEEYPFMTSCNNDELANHVLAPEEEYARAGNAYWWNIATNKPFSGLALENWTDFHY